MRGRAQRRGNAFGTGVAKALRMRVRVHGLRRDADTDEEDVWVVQLNVNAPQ